VEGCQEDLKMGSISAQQLVIYIQPLYSDSSPLRGSQRFCVDGRIGAAAPILPSTQKDLRSTVGAEESEST
jgi:hypothetical protein